jgi:hypothetical protein
MSLVDSSLMRVGSWVSRSKTKQHRRYRRGRMRHPMSLLEGLEMRRLLAATPVMEMTETPQSAATSVAFLNSRLDNHDNPTGSPVIVGDTKDPNLLIIPPNHVSTITDLATLGLTTSSGWNPVGNINFTVPQFDTMGGTRVLVGIDVHYEATMVQDFNFNIQNLDSQLAEDIESHGVGHFDFNDQFAGGPDLTGDVNVDLAKTTISPFTGSFTDSSHLTVLMHDISAQSSDFTVTQADADFASYIGSGSLLYTLASNGSSPLVFNRSSLDNAQTLITTVVRAKVAITYFFVEPEARIKIEPNATNGITEPHQFTALVEADDGLTPQEAIDFGVGDDTDGFAPVEGVLTTITLINDATAVADPAGPFMGNTDSNGEFVSDPFTSATPGTVTGRATATVDVLGLLIDVSTGPAGVVTPGSGPDAEKTFVCGKIRWEKVDDMGMHIGGATFEVTAIAGTAAGLTPLSTGDIVDNGALDADPGDGFFELDAYQFFNGQALDCLALGTYRITEVSPPPDHDLGAIIFQDVTVDLNNLDVAAAMPFVNPKRVGEGRTPGFWKNHLDAWEGFSPTQKLSDVFSFPSSLSSLGNSTLLQALSFKGGSSLSGAAQILLRAAVASLLNSASSFVDFPLSTATVISDTNTALASNNRGTILDQAAEFDELNNLGGG